MIEEKDVNLTEADVVSCIGKFTGDIEQIPPMYSAIKVGGKKLYELAREGKTIERKPRPVTIHSIEIISMDLPRVSMRISCSKGTYIRTLCNDIGASLGCGACMESLKRTRSGLFEIKDAVKLSAVQQWADDGSLEEHLISVEDMFSDCPVIRVTPEEDKLLHNGNTLKARPDGTSQRYRVYDSQGVFYGVYNYDTKRKILKPYKMFIP